MEQTVQGVIRYLRERAAQAPVIGKTIKFHLEEGVVFIDLRSDPPRVHQENLDADCTVSTNVGTLVSVLSGELLPMVAVLTHQVRLQGDVEAAITLQSLFS